MFHPDELLGSHQLSREIAPLMCQVPNEDEILGAALSAGFAQPFLQNPNKTSGLGTPSEEQELLSVHPFQPEG